MSNEPESDQQLTAVVAALLKQLKQPPVTKELKVPGWVEKRFGIPQSGEEVLWRLAWLVAIPAIATLMTLPVLDWLWGNGFPWIVLLTCLALGLVYWAIYYYASHAAAKLRSLVDVQFAIPLAVIWFVIVWETIS